MENWKDINGFPGYQVSDQGRVRTFWKRKHYPTGYGSYNIIGDTPKIMSQSNDGNGYMKVMLYNQSDKKRYCKKVHRLVAESFINHDSCYDTVDHIRSGAIGKLDNSVKNLRWVTRVENVQKAYRDGMCDERIRKSRQPIMAIDLWAGKERYFESIVEASRSLGVNNGSISHILSGDYERAGRYTFEHAGREEVLLYGGDNQILSWV